MAATSTPMNAKSATLAAMPIAEYKLPPEALNGPKLPALMKNQPTTPIKASGRNFSTTVTFCSQATCRSPARLTAAGTHRPSSAIPQSAHPDGCPQPNSTLT